MTTLFTQYQQALDTLRSVEEHRIRALSAVDEKEVRSVLSRWITVLTRFLTRHLGEETEYSKDRVFVHIPVNVERKTVPILGYDDIRSIDTPSENKAQYIHLESGDLRTLFKADATSVGQDPEINISLSQEEYQELLPTSEEEPWLYLIGARLFVNGVDQYGNRVDVV